MAGHAERQRLTSTAAVTLGGTAGCRSPQRPRGKVPTSAELPLDTGEVAAEFRPGEKTPKLG